MYKKVTNFFAENFHNFPFYTCDNYPIYIDPVYKKKESTAAASIGGTFIKFWVMEWPQTVVFELIEGPV